MTVTLDQYEKLGSLLVDQTVPVKSRYRALFTLKSLGGKEAIKQIAKGFADPSALLKHECAYCLGQMQDESAIADLIAVLSTLDEDPMVRHEAGEALGAIGLNTAEVNGALRKFLNDPHSEVVETCQIALDRLEWVDNNNNNTSQEKLSRNPYESVDPAPPLASTDIAELKRILLDEEIKMFERYRAMFQLRNQGSEDAILALCEGLKCKSALFRHEIGYVLGQIQSPLSIKALADNLKQSGENHMVRHECAEALGSVGTDECSKILSGYLNDPQVVVKESCEVALDITEHEQSGDFQYATGLAQI